MREPIYVTKTFLPPKEEYETYLDTIWRSGHITNTGPLAAEFESRTKKYLGVDNFLFVANGTLALQVALRALEIDDGEVITTPFSYVATTSAILWEHLTPVYVDIDAKTLNIDPTKIEAAITDKTKAILAVHVFGNPCDVEAIEAIATKHDLRVIYDAAHAFGVTYKGKSLLDYGDISICSFHATKLFHTIEGGAIIAKDTAVHDKAELMRRFGHTGDEHYILGINAKASEFQAAMGLCNLNYIDGNILKRREATELYDQKLNGLFQRPVIHPQVHYNYAYYPVLLQNESELERVVNRLKDINVFPRRYFYPSLNKLPYIPKTEDCPVSEDIATRILCLPLYADLAHQDITTISEVLSA